MVYCCVISLCSLTKLFTLLHPLLFACCHKRFVKSLSFCFPKQPLGWDRSTFLCSLVALGHGVAQKQHRSGWTCARARLLLPAKAELSQTRLGRTPSKQKTCEPKTKPLSLCGRIMFNSTNEPNIASCDSTIAVSNFRCLCCDLPSQRIERSEFWYSVVKRRPRVTRPREWSQAVPYKLVRLHPSVSLDIAIDHSHQSAQGRQRKY